MSTTTSTAKDWILFLISLAIMIGIMATRTEWFWLALPSTVTFFVRGMRWI